MCGGDQVVYSGNVSIKTTDLTTTKILINSVLSTPAAKMALSHLKDFILGLRWTGVWVLVHVRIPIHMIPDSIMALYELHDLMHYGYV